MRNRSWIALVALAWLLAAPARSFATPLAPPDFSPQMPVDAPQTIPAAVSAGTLASNGSGYLSVWVDYHPPLRSIVVAPVDASGDLGARTEISTPNSRDDEPTAAALGERYLVAWHHTDFVQSDQSGLCARVAAADGTPVGDLTRLATDAYVFTPPTIAATSQSFVVTYLVRGSPRPQAIASLRVSADGAVLDSAPLVWTATPSGYIASAASPDVVLVAWTERPVGGVALLRAARIAADGTLLDPSGFDLASIPIGPTGGGAPSVAFTGSDFVVAWNETSSSRLVGLRVGRDGSLVDATPFTITTGAGYLGGPILSANANHLLVAWMQSGSGATAMMATELDFSGGRLAPNDEVLSPNVDAGHQHSLASDGTGFLAGWVTNGWFYNFEGTRIDAAGTPLDATPLTLAEQVSTQYRSVVASDGDQFLVTWWDVRGADFGLYSGRVQANGSRLDPDGIRVTHDPVDTWDVAWNGDTFLVVWESQAPWPGAVRATRIGRDGTVLDPVGITIAEAPDVPGSPHVAASDADFLVVWQDERPALPSRILGARVAADGTVRDGADAPLVLAAGDEPASSPSVTWNGRDFYLAWVAGDLFGARVDRSGQVLDPGGVRLATPYGASLDAPVARANLEQTLVAWEDSSQSQSDVFGVLVGNDGRVASAGGFPIEQDPLAQHDVAIVPHESEFFVTWREQTSRVVDEAYRIRGVRLDRRGAKRDSEPFVIEEAARDDPGGVAIDREGRALVTFDARVDDPGEIADRVRARVVTLPHVPSESGCNCSTTGASQARPIPLGCVTLLLFVIASRRVRRSRRSVGTFSCAFALLSAAGCNEDLPSYQAFVPDVPTVATPCGTQSTCYIAAPRIVPVFFSDSPHQTEIVDFLERYVRSDAWRDSTREYGVSKTSLGTPVHLPMQAPVTLAWEDVGTWLSDRIASDGEAVWGPLDGWALYVVYVPGSTTVTWGGMPSCSSFLAAHWMTSVQNTFVPFALVTSCVPTLDALTESTSHELVEAVTDPNPYLGFNVTDAAWVRVYGGEVGDLCERRPGVRYVPADVGYSVVHTWSNALAQAHVDPCGIIPPEGGYFASTPLLPNYLEMSTDVVYVSLALGVIIPVAESRTIDVELWSDGPTSGPWSVEAHEVTTGAKTLSFAWDATSGSNGDVLHLTITAVAPAQAGATFEITSSLGEAKTSWVGAVSNH